MVTKALKTDPRIRNDRVGLMLSRQQIKTIAHTDLEQQMMMDNSTNIYCLGSCDKFGVEGNPFTQEQKKIAHQGIWGDIFKICMLRDIGSTDLTSDWADYVFDHIKARGLPEPTDLYSGSKHDARWYEDHFVSLEGEPNYTRGRFKVWENPSTGKRIHILDREQDGISASAARTLIEQRNPGWKSMVPAKLWDFYEWEYPPHLRVAIQIDDTATTGDPNVDFPTADQVPVGTKCVYAKDPKTVYILRDDKKWRPRQESESRKSMGD